MMMMMMMMEMMMMMIIIITIIHALQLAGFIFAVGFYRPSPKARPIRNWLSFLMKRGFTWWDT
jgi:hypothetical protein